MSSPVGMAGESYLVFILNWVVECKDLLPQPKAQPGRQEEEELKERLHTA